jgi:hypothetical protein
VPVPRAVLLARRNSSFPWKHPSEVVLGASDHVHQAKCGPALLNSDGTEQRDAYGFAVLPWIKCCMLVDLVGKHSDATHCKGNLVNHGNDAVTYLRQWYHHVLKSNCARIYEKHWFPSNNVRVWLQVHPKGPLVRLLVSACLLHRCCFVAVPALCGC